jgi:beta-aspartyl-peptidase (threonine type)
MIDRIYTLVCIFICIITYISAHLHIVFSSSGEEFMRHLVAYDISARMGYCGQDILSAATATVFDRLPKDSGGVIAVDRLGRSAMVFNSSGMYRAMVGEDGTAQIGIWEDIECFQIR